MNSEEIEGLRPVYELWWEYLKRSQSYKEFCEWYRQEKQDVFEKEQMLSGRKISLQLKEQPLVGKDAIPNALHHRAMEYNEIKRKIWDYFGDVHVKDFDEWWPFYKKLLFRSDDTFKKDGALKQYSFDYDFDMCVAAYQDLKDRNPTIEEIKECLGWAMQWNRRTGMHVLSVNVRHPDGKAAIAKDFARILRQERRASERTGPLPLPTMPNRPYDLKALKRYLWVYDLRIRLSVDETVQEILRDNDDSEAAYDNTACSRDLGKAKRIIRNVERGYFPGKY